MLYSGEGVEKNYNDSFTWVKRAAEQELPIAVKNMAFHYENGIGVPQNYEFALRWYQKAQELGEANVLNKIDKMKELLECSPSGDPLLILGTPLTCARRPVLRANAEKFGAVPVFLEDDLNFDVYDGTKIVSDSEDLVLTYRLYDDRLATVQYSFSSSKDRGQLSRAYTIFRNKHGNSLRRPKDQSSGIGTYFWLLDNKIILELKRESLESRTYATYKNGRNAIMLEKEVEYEKSLKEK